MSAWAAGCIAAACLVRAARCFCTVPSSQQPPCWLAGWLGELAAAAAAAFHPPAARPYQMAAPHSQTPNAHQRSLSSSNWQALNPVMSFWPLPGQDREGDEWGWVQRECAAPSTTGGAWARTADPENKIDCRGLSWCPGASSSRVKQPQCGKQGSPRHCMPLEGGGTSGWGAQTPIWEAR